MINKITRNQLSDMFQSIADIMADKEEELCKRDAQLGDGDLGLTMKKGFGALPKIVQGLESPELSKTIMKAAMLMSSLIPSTMGFLMSSGLMEAGKSLSEKSFIDADGLVQFLVGYGNGIVKRGKCSVGERTVLDSMDAAAKAAQEELKKILIQVCCRLQSRRKKELRLELKEQNLWFPNMEKQLCIRKRVKELKIKEQ